jgi:hypothetical protein
MGHPVYINTLYIMYALALKAPLSRPQNQYFNYTMRSTKLHKTYRMYIHFWKLVFSNRVGSKDVTCGWCRAWRVFQWAGQNFRLFYILRTTSRCIQICSGCIAATCTPPPPSYWAWFRTRSIPHLLPRSGVPRNFSRGGSTNSVEDRGQRKGIWGR